MRSALLRSTRSTALPPRWVSTGRSTLSSVVRHGSNNGFWNMNPVRRPAYGRVIWPPEGFTSRAIALSKVDLPQPLGPRSDTNSPRRTGKLTLSIATMAPKRTWRASIERMGMAGVIGAASIRPVRTIAFMANSLARLLDVERLGNVDRLLLKAGGEQELLRRSPAGLVHVTDRL